MDQPSVVAGNFALSFSLNVLSISVHISGSTRPITLIWASLEISFPPAEVEYRWCQFCSKVMTSEVEEGPRLVTAGWLVTAGYRRHRSQWVKHLPTGPKENSKFCFPETLNVPLGFTSEHIEVKGKQNSLFPAGPIMKCFAIPANSKIGHQGYCLVDAGWLTDLPQRSMTWSCASRKFTLLFPLGFSELCSPYGLTEFWPMTYDMFSSNRKTYWVWRYNKKCFYIKTKLGFGVSGSCVLLHNTLIFICNTCMVATTFLATVVQRLHEVTLCADKLQSSLVLTKQTTLSTR